MPPFRIADNPDSPLDVADIVFFDPPNTGFSRILPDGKDEQFLGVQQDARTTVAFITGWVNAHKRWNVPKYLLGESYGTIRAAVTAKLLVGGPTTTGHLEATTLNGVLQDWRENRLIAQVIRIGPPLMPSSIIETAINARSPSSILSCPPVRRAGVPEPDRCRPLGDPRRPFLTIHRGDRGGLCCIRPAPNLTLFEKVAASRKARVDRRG